MSEGKRITLRDIASACGVSVMTVSRVMRNERYVKADVREKVTATAERLGYRPDPALAALNQHRRGAKDMTIHGEAVALIVPTEPEYGWGLFPVLQELEADIAKSAEQLGYRMERVSVAASGRGLHAALEKLYRKGVRCLLLAPTIRTESIVKSAWNRFYVVALECGTGEVLFHGVRNDFFQMATCALESLDKMGARRIGYVVGPGDALVHHRPAGAMAAYALAHRALKTDLFHVDAWADAMPPKFSTWLEAFRPDALVSMTTFPKRWLWEEKRKQFQNLQYVQLNRPLADTSVHGVCVPPMIHGSKLVQRVHQLMLENEVGLPESRTVLRVDGVWHEKVP